MTDLLFLLTKSRGPPDNRKRQQHVPPSPQRSDAATSTMILHHPSSSPTATTTSFPSISAYVPPPRHELPVSDSIFHMIGPEQRAQMLAWLEDREEVIGVLTVLFLFFAIVIAFCTSGRRSWSGGMSIWRKRRGECGMLKKGNSEGGLLRVF